MSDGRRSERIGGSVGIGRTRARWLLVALGTAAAFAGIGVGAAGPAGATSCDPGTVTITWDGGAATNAWTDAANWSTDAVPGPSDHVCIDQAGAAVQLTGTSVSIQSLEVKAGASLAVQAFSELDLTSTTVPSTVSTLAVTDAVLGGDADLTVTGSFDLTTGGEQRGAGTTTVAPGAALYLDNAVLGGTRHLVISAGATATWSGPANMTMRPGTEIANAGSLTITGDATLAATATEMFSNTGTITKTSSGTTTIQATFANAGTVDIQAGVLDLANGDGGSSSGAFQVAAGTLLKLRGSSYSFSSTASFTGAGAVSVVQGGVAAFGAGVAYGLPSISVDPGGHLDLNDDFVIPDISVTNAFLGGTGAVTASGAFACDSCVLGGSGITTVGSGVSVALDEGQLSVEDSHRFVIAPGATFTWSTDDNIVLGGAAELDNAGSFLITGGGLVASDPNQLFRNTGTITKTSSATNAFNGSFDNDGTVDVEAGTLQLFGGDGGDSSSGAFQVAEGAHLDFRDRGTNGYDLPGTASITGQGVVTIAQGGVVTLEPGMTLDVPTVDVDFGGSLFLNGDVTIPTLSLTRAVLGGPGDLTVTDSMSVNFLTDIRDDGVVTIAPGAGLVVDTDGGSVDLFYDRHIAVDAGATFTASGDQRLYLRDTSRIDNAGTFTIDGVGGVLGDATARISNTGTAVFDPGFARTIHMDAPFDDPGSLTVASGDAVLSGGGETSGTTKVAAGASLQYGGGSYITDGTSNTIVVGEAGVSSGSLEVGGTLQVDQGGTFASTGGQTIVDASSNTIVDGEMDVSGGTVDLDGPAQMSALSVSGGTVNLNVDVHPTDVEISGGTLAGSGHLGIDDSFHSTGSPHMSVATDNEGAMTVSDGTLTMDDFGTNDGSIDVASTGTLHVQALSQSGSGTLSMHVAGTSPGAGYGALSSPGTVAAGGTLAIVTDPGFSPAAGQSFLVVTASAVTGAFDSTTGTEVGDGHTYDVNVGGTGVTLVAHGVGSDGSTAALAVHAAWVQDGTEALAPGALTLKDGGVPIASFATDVMRNLSDGSNCDTDAERAAGCVIEVGAAAGPGGKTIKTFETITGWIPTFAGDCGPDGAVTLKRRQHLTCSVTNVLPDVVPSGADGVLALSQTWVDRYGLPFLRATVTVTDALGQTVATFDTDQMVSGPSATPCTTGSAHQAGCRILVGVPAAGPGSVFTVTEDTTRDESVATVAGDCQPDGTVSVATHQLRACALTLTTTPLGSSSPTGDMNITHLWLERRGLPVRAARVTVTDFFGQTVASFSTDTMFSEAGGLCATRAARLAGCVIDVGLIGADQNHPFTVSETNPDGLVPTFADGCDPPGTLPVVPGQAAICTITAIDPETGSHPPTGGVLTVSHVWLDRSNHKLHKANITVLDSAGNTVASFSTDPMFSLAGGRCDNDAARRAGCVMDVGVIGADQNHPFTVTDTNTDGLVATFSDGCTPTGGGHHVPVTGRVTVTDGQAAACTVTATHRDDGSSSPTGMLTVSQRWIDPRGAPLGSGTVTVMSDDGRHQVARFSTDSMWSLAGGKCSSEPAREAGCVYEVSVVGADQNHPFTVTEQAATRRVVTFGADCAPGGSVAVAAGQMSTCELTTISVDEGPADADAVIAIDAAWLQHLGVGSPSETVTVVDHSFHTVASFNTSDLWSKADGPCTTDARRDAGCVGYVGVPGRRGPFTVTVTGSPGWIVTLGGDCSITGLVQVTGRGRFADCVVTLVRY